MTATAQPPSRPEVRSIPALAQLSGRLYTDEEAVVDGATRLTFGELAALARRATAGFRARGVRPGDRVALWAPNSWQWIVAALGLHGAGAVVVPINTRFKGDEAAYIADRVDAAMLVTVRGFLGTDHVGLLREAAPRLRCLQAVVVTEGPVDDGELTFGALLDHGTDGPDVEADIAAVGPGDTADIIFTSGTTGRPKGVMLDHGVSVAGYRLWADTFGLRRGDRYLIVNPFFHCFGYKAGWLACLLQGATALPLAVFDPDVALDLIATERVSAIAGPPTLYLSVLERARQDQLRTLRTGFVGATAVAPELLRRLRDELPLESLTTGYGLTESHALVSMTRPGDDPERVARWNGGFPFDGVEVRVVDADGDPQPPEREGEIVVRGFSLMAGYFDDPDSNRAVIDADGWLHTGDIGMLSPAGELRITDRLKDIYISGGFNVSPAEVESCLAEHDTVGQVAVIGVADERFGEVGAAFVVPREGADVDVDAVIAHARRHLANFKVPRHVRIVAGLPLNATGKVLKGELRAAWRAEIST